MLTQTTPDSSESLCLHDRVQIALAIADRPALACQQFCVGADTVE